MTEGEDFYLNELKQVVFTEKYHLKRGSCCGSGCRHCPYPFEFRSQEDAKFSIVRFRTLKESLWQNQKGRKVDIASSTSPMTWTLFFAYLDHDAPFSDFSGYDRTIALISGKGFSLNGQRILDPRIPFRFDGGLKPFCELESEPCFVLNVMSERLKFSHSMEILDLPNLKIVKTFDETIFIVCLLGSLTIENTRFNSYQTHRSWQLNERDSLRIGEDLWVKGSHKSRMAIIRLKNYLS